MAYYGYSLDSKTMTFDTDTHARAALTASVLSNQVNPGS
jgi:hypothetical protein